MFVFVNINEGVVESVVGSYDENELYDYVRDSFGVEYADLVDVAAFDNVGDCVESGIFGVDRVEGGLFYG